MAYRVKREPGWKRRSLRFLAGVFVVVLPHLCATGCRETDPAGEVAGTGAPAEAVVVDSVLERGSGVPFTTVENGLRSGFRAGDPRFGAAEMIFRDRRSWVRFWRQHDESGRPCPRVRFHREMIVAVHLGSQSSSGQSHPCITVSEILKSPIGWVVQIRGDERPGPLDAISSPFHIVKLPRLRGSIRFEHDRPLPADPDVPCDEVPCRSPEGPASAAISSEKGGGEDLFAHTITVPFTTIEKSNSGFRLGDYTFDAAEMVFRDSVSWCAFWNLHEQHAIPRRPCPPVDFAREMVIVACLGWQANQGGFHPCITITEIRKSPMGWVVEVRSDERNGNFNAIGNPAHIVKLRKLRGPILFEHDAPIAGDPSSPCLFPTP